MNPTSLVPVVRPAVAADAAAIVAVHHAAVHRSAAAAYPRETLDAWSGPPGEARFRRMREVIEEGDELVLVAEVEGSRIVGFGAVIPRLEELRSLYVDPDAGGRGVGTRLLAALERLAVERGLARLTLNSSVNAEGFYRRAGYATVERGVHRLGSGHELACVRMVKAMAGRG